MATPTGGWRLRWAPPGLWRGGDGVLAVVVGRRSADWRPRSWLWWGGVASARPLQLPGRRGRAGAAAGTTRSPAGLHASHPSRGGLAPWWCGSPSGAQCCGGAAVAGSVMRGAASWWCTPPSTADVGGGWSATVVVVLLRAQWRLRGVGTLLGCGGGGRRETVLLRRMCRGEQLQQVVRVPSVSSRQDPLVDWRRCLRASLSLLREPIWNCHLVAHCLGVKTRSSHGRATTAPVGDVSSLEASSLEPRSRDGLACCFGAALADGGLSVEGQAKGGLPPLTMTLAFGGRPGVFIRMLFIRSQRSAVPRDA